jgi:O-methyltransferase
MDLHPAARHTADLYLQLLKQSLGDFLYDYDRNSPQTPVSYSDSRTGQKYHISDYAELKYQGLIGSQTAHTLIGMLRMNQLQEAVETVLREEIPGDLIETGALRGGACILMRGILAAWQDTQRKVWVADSFEGFPPETMAAFGLESKPIPNASLADVQDNFRRYGLLDEQVMFLPGWFKDTLPAAPIEELAVLRLDGDFYEATRESLDWLYPKVSSGGFVIIDDYYAFEDCRRAVREYRQRHQISTPLVRVDATCVYWRKA